MSSYAGSIPAGTVRPARLSDAPAIWPLVQDFATSFVPERAAFDATLARVIDDEDLLCLVAELDGLLVGYLLADRHPAFFANGLLVWVEELMVAEAARRRGVGELLMAAAEAWGRDADAAYVGLATRRAAPFYTALGYEESATFFRRLL